MAVLIFLDQLKLSRVLVYRKDLITSIIQTGGNDFQVMSFSSVNQCVKRLGSILTDTRSLEVCFDKYVANGVIVWLGLKDNIVVSVAYTFQVKNNAQYFFDLKENEVVISGCEIHPACRGKGLYVRSLQIIMSELAKEGMRSFHIYCPEWNWPSSRGIEKAGFKLIGYGWDKKGKLTFKPL